ncbi:hypothetical protein DPX16_6623 [Anabarilius grahami]|uniref:Uncharacterized protein n=1 Tax=Anabarilius grahami TaxID=495550 RepID=A0A3N0Z2M2_ANAGA|nr:hypothetical protein DPX16_6623 [Anabarilius grahami]
MDFAPVHLMCLEQGDRSLEEHLTDFLDLVPLTTFPDDALCSFLFAGLNTTTRAQLSGKGPRESFAFVEWVLVSCGSAFTVEDVTSPTPTPVPSQNPPVGTKQFEPTADFQPFFAASCEPMLSRTCVPNIAAEPEICESDQVCVPAASPTCEGASVESEGKEENLAHPPPLRAPTGSISPLSGVDTPRASWELCPPGQEKPTAPPTTLAEYTPPSHDSRVDHQPFGLTGLPWSVGYTWVRPRHTCASDSGPLSVGRPPPEPPPAYVSTIRSAGCCHPVTSPSLQPSATSSFPSNTLPPSLFSCFCFC